MSFGVEELLVSITSGERLESTSGEVNFNGRLWLCWFPGGDDDGRGVVRATSDFLTLTGSSTDRAVEIDGGNEDSEDAERFIQAVQVSARSEPRA
ncbi:uncharacterized protein IUM83_04058 [Phytophthora cinnamomi]|uniref:uncharacterized protein n=1 Tax=Phytophthora cinnamomi TaxID=4785 RepID=UPI00355A0F97|nr:hypothetical protein IUM83_04058 [Phytophthora cinnamomi]